MRPYEFDAPRDVSVRLTDHRRNDVLDGLRGVAAIAVVMYHMGQALHLPLLPGAYLAVDFFFVLSGFVLWRAYGQKDRTPIPLMRFAKMRLVRLYPLLLLGVALGLVKSLAVYFFAKSMHLEVHQIITAGVLNSLFLPLIGPSGPLFPLNVPQWSLLFELIASVGLFMLFVRGPRSLPYVFAIAGAGAMVAQVAIRGGDLNLGWDSETLWLGFARVSFAFSAGVIIARRSGLRVIGSSPLSVVILAILPALYAWDPPYSLLSGRDLTMAIVLSPAVVLIGSHIDPPSHFRKLLAFLGDISYPLYATHYPILLGVCFICFRINIPTLSTIALTLVITFSFAFVAGRYLDQPARAWLSRRLGLRESARPLVL